MINNYKSNQSLSNKINKNSICITNKKQYENSKIEFKKIILYLKSYKLSQLNSMHLETDVSV